MRADRPGMDKALRLVDRRTVSQRYLSTGTEVSAEVGG